MALLLYYVKLCAPFQIHRWIQTGVRVQKRSIRVEIGDILSSVTFKFDGGILKTIGHVFYTTLRFVHQFEVMGEFKMELQSGNAQFGSKLALFCPVWLWNLTDYLEKHRAPRLCYTLSFVHHFKAICEFKLELQSWNAQFGSKSTLFCPVWPWNLTDDLEKNRAPLLCCFKLCASFHSHWWIGELVKLELQSWTSPWNLTDDLENHREPLPSNIKLCASFHCHMWIQTGVTVRKQLSWVWPLWPWPLTSDLDLCMDVTFVNGNNSWKFHDRQTDRRTDGRKEVFLELLGRSYKKSRLRQKFDCFGRIHVFTKNRGYNRTAHKIQTDHMHLRTRWSPLITPFKQHCINNHHIY